MYSSIFVEPEWRRIRNKNRGRDCTGYNRENVPLKSDQGKHSEIRNFAELFIPKLPDSKNAPVISGSTNDVRFVW